jgi:glycosyltransferase involved in cell wall biosynthesis
VSGERPLKILQVGSGFPGWGGTELHLLNLSEQLVARGHRVTVAARPGKFVEAEAQKRGLPTVPLTVKRQWDFHDAGAFRRLIQREKFDVVHVHWSTDYVVAPLVARQCGVPVVVMSRHSPYRLKSAVGRYLYDRVLFDRIIALSESVRQTLLGQGMRPEHIVTIHHGTDTEAFRHTTLDPGAVRADWGIPADAFVVGLAGRIAEEKGWRTFLQAVARLVAAPALYAVLIGDGPQAEEAKALAAELNLDGRLVFAGFRSDVNNAINALDVKVLASTWAEPCAAVVQQAMALSKPVIGTNLGGTPEMIVDGETGLLVPPGDPEALAGAIAQLAADPARRAAMGVAGRARADSLFTLRVMTDRNEALYQEILRTKQAGAARPAHRAPQPAK